MFHKYMRNFLLPSLFFIGFVRAFGQAPCTINSFTLTPAAVDGQPLTLSVDVTDATSYQWYDTSSGEGVPIPGATSASYTFTPTLDNYGMTYQADGSCSSAPGSWGTTVSYVYPVPAATPTTTKEQFLGIQSAASVADNLGFVLSDTTNETVQFAEPKALGARWLRTDVCNWETSEVQNIPANTSAGFNPPNECINALTFAAKYGIKLDLLAYWGPPSGTFASGTLASAITTGDTSIQVTITTGSIPSSCPANDVLLTLGTAGALNYPIANGAPITSFSGSTFTLVQPAQGADVSGDTVTIRCMLYHPALIPLQTSPISYVNNESLQAWKRYIQWVQGYCVFNGVFCVIEEYNEPEQLTQLWDAPQIYIPSPPPYFGIPAGSQGDGRILAYSGSFYPSVPTAQLCNGWTNLAGDRGIFLNDPNNATQYLADFKTVKESMYCDLSHVYGNNPEQAMFDREKLENAVKTRSFSYSNTSLIGSQVGGNMKYLVYTNHQSFTRGGLQPGISETGQVYGAPYMARFANRQFFGMTALGEKPVIFFQWQDFNNPFQWVDNDTDLPTTPQAIAMAHIMLDVNSIAGPVIGPVNQCLAPQLRSYNGYWPVDTTAIVGTRVSGPTPTANSYMMTAWAQDYTVPPPGSSGEGTFPEWPTLPTTPTVPITYTMPIGYTLTSVYQTNSVTTVPFTVSGNIATISAVDTDPIEAIFDPLPGTVQSNTCVVDQ